MRQYPAPHDTKGFTLIEMAIVVLIIGMVVAGIFTAKSLIESSRYTMIISDEQRIQTAVSEFEQKYNCLPGDCPNASNLGFGSVFSTVFSANGNGDGKIGNTGGYIESCCSSNDYEYEYVNFWLHLSQAGLLGNYQQPPVYYFIALGAASNWPAADKPYGYGYPSRYYKCTWWVGFGAHGDTQYLNEVPPMGNMLLLAGPNTACGFNTCGASVFSECMTPYTAYMIDSKLDDGMALVGNVQGSKSGLYIDNDAQGGAGGTQYQCVPDGLQGTGVFTTGYLTGNSMPHCNLEFKLNTK